MEHVVLGARLNRNVTPAQRASLASARRAFISNFVTSEPGVAKWVEACEELLFARAVVAGAGEFAAVLDHYNRLTGDVEDTRAAVTLAKEARRANVDKERAQRSKSRGRKTEQRNDGARPESPPTMTYNHPVLHLHTQHGIDNFCKVLFSALALILLYAVSNLPYHR